MKQFFVLSVSFLTAVFIPHGLAETVPLSDSTPGWVREYRENPAPEWSGWKNSLKPKGEAAAPVQLAKDGKTEYRILIPAAATLPERRAADELRLWLGEITGAEFAITDDPEIAGEKSLRIGRVAGSAFGEEPDRGKLDDGRYTLRVEGDTVFFEGPGFNSPLMAAYAFMEEDLGVRWLDGPIAAKPDRKSGRTYTDMYREMDSMLRDEPKVDGVYSLPSDPNLTVEIVPRESVPAYPIRGFTDRESSRPWALRNRINMSPNADFNHTFYSGGLFVHTFHKLVPPEKYFESHPEYFSLVDGERRWERAQIDMSNPEVAEIAAQTIIERLRNRPEKQQMASVSAMDWLGFSEDEESRRIEEETGAFSGLMLTFVNRVAEKVAKVLPNAMITTLSYAETNRAPTADMKIHPNVVIRYCTDWGANFEFPYHSFYDKKLAMPIEGDPNRYLPQIPSLERWMELTNRFHLWLYPHQYRHNWAPTPNIRAVAENIRFFAEKGFESAFVQQETNKDESRQAMRFWLWSKLMWDPNLDVDALMADFIGAYYGEAAPDIWDYNRLLWHQAAFYNDYVDPRYWIYAVGNEGMYDHGFVEKALAILEPALEKDLTPEQRRSVEELIFGVLYVQMTRHRDAMAKGEMLVSREQFHADNARLIEMGENLGVTDLGFYDGARSEMAMDDFQKALRLAETRAFDRLVLENKAWSNWTWRLDPENVGIEQQWFVGGESAPDGWEAVQVPAFLPSKPVGYFWYRVTFQLTEEQANTPASLYFGGVDEQAWVYLNGKYLGEHTLTSEFIVGDEITVGDLWDRPFTLELKPGQLRAGENELYVRVHNSAYGAGIHQPVELEFLQTPGQFTLNEDFAGTEGQLFVQGDAFETDRSKAHGKWSVPGGSVSLDDSTEENEITAAVFSLGGSSLRFDLKEPAKGRVELKLNLSQLDGRSDMDTFRVFLRDQNGQSYELGMSTIGPHYGTGGLSGFALFNPENNARIGVHGKHLRTDIDPQTIRLVLDPKSGVAFYYDNDPEPMIRFPGPPQIGAVASIEFRGGSHGITWQVDGFELQSGE